MWELGLAARQKEELEQRHGGVGTLCPRGVAGDEACDVGPVRHSKKLQFFFPGEVNGIIFK